MSPRKKFEASLAIFPDQEFRDLIIAIWETGCRPQEAFKVEARHVDKEQGRWVFKLREKEGRFCDGAEIVVYSYRSLFALITCITSSCFWPSRMSLS